MHLHILGICGTFMGSLAILAKELGHEVSGCDTHVYPPMSTQLEAAGIKLMEGYEPEHLSCGADLFVVGNAMSRGNPMVEALLNRNLPYVSGPQWLAEHVLQGRWVIAAAGTHGKTTTSSMVAWILEYAGLKPGFLIGGVPQDFGISARLGDTPFFVVEADEYDTAFFDKRSKFVHYRPRTAILNNLEFDHADIFEGLAAIQKQFHHFVRIVPGDGLVVAPVDDQPLKDVLAMGCWTPIAHYSVGDGAPWSAQAVKADASQFDVLLDGEILGQVNWAHGGEHNMRNALSAIIAGRHAGVPPEQAVEALSQFKGIKRRMELLGNIGGVCVYDDFAHHPTAIATTLAGLRNKVMDIDGARIIAVIEPRSNTMRMGVHGDKLAQSVALADQVLWYQPSGMDWNLQSLVAGGGNSQVYDNVGAIIETAIASSRNGDHIVVMSNGGFEGIHKRLLAALEQTTVAEGA